MATEARPRNTRTPQTNRGARAPKTDGVREFDLPKDTPATDASRLQRYAKMGFEITETSWCYHLKGSENARQARLKEYMDTARHHSGAASVARSSEGTDIPGREYIQSSTMEEQTFTVSDLLDDGDDAGGEGLTP